LKHPFLKGVSKRTPHLWKRERIEALTREKEY